MKKWKKGLLIAIAAIIVAGGIGFFLYVGDYYHADAIAQEMETAGELTPDADTILKVEKENDWMIVEPTEVSAQETEKIGLIFYPGGKVEYTAYLPQLEKIASRGIHCYLVEMPFNLAFFGANRAEDVMKAHPEIDAWYMGGHSLGGAFASNYASKHSDNVQGVVLLGAYVYGDYPVEQSITIYGSNDLVLNRDKITYDENVHVIAGGNHGQFGNYGSQEGDGTATISADEQQEETAELIAEFVR